MSTRRSNLRTASRTTRRFFEAVESSTISESELSRVSGIHPNTFYGWESGKAAATVFNLESALSVIGYELVIRPINPDQGKAA